MNINEYYRTSNFELAVFLITKDFHLLNIENVLNTKNDSSRKVFIFDHLPELKTLVRVFYFNKYNDPEILVDARKLFQARRRLKTQLINLEYHDKE